MQVILPRTGHISRSGPLAAQAARPAGQSFDGTVRNPTYSSSAFLYKNAFSPKLP